MTDFKRVCRMIKFIFVRRSLFLICFAVLLIVISCDSDEEPTVAVTGVCVSDDGTPIPGMRMTFASGWDKPLPIYCETDINGVFTSHIPRKYDRIGASSVDMDTGYYWVHNHWSLKVDPEVMHTIMVPRLSEIVLNFEPKEPAEPDSWCKVRVEYDLNTSGHSSFKEPLAQEEEFNLNAINTKGKSIRMPRNQQILLHITKYAEGFKIVGALDTMFIASNRKSYLTLRW